MACPECLTTSLKLEERLYRLGPCAFAVVCTYVSLLSVKFALYDAVCHFNNGSRGTLDILNQAGIEPGLYTTKACVTK